MGKPVVSPTRLVCGLACGLSGRAKLTEDSATLRVGVLGAIKVRLRGLTIGEPAERVDLSSWELIDFGPIVRGPPWYQPRPSVCV